MIPTLRKFRGAQSKQIWGGASLETFSGEAQLKKSPCISFLSSSEKQTLKMSNKIINKIKYKIICKIIKM